MSQQRPGTGGLDPILTAKGRIPALPHPHVPRPRVRAALSAALRECQLVVLAAGAMTGKTTALAELARVPEIGRVSWYSADEVDACSRVLLEGLIRATGEAVPPMGDELHLLGALIAALDRSPAHTVLIVDDIHRVPQACAVLGRLLRYLPPRAHLLLSGWPGRNSLSTLHSCLEDQGQVAHLDAALLRLDEEEQERFRALTGRTGGAWTVDYRPGGRPSVVERLRRGVLPLLTPDERAIVDLLALLPGATVALLAAACAVPDDEVLRRVMALREETILLERTELPHVRLSELAQQAALAGLDESTARLLRLGAAAACEPRDPAQAAYLFARAGNLQAAGVAARRVSWWEWNERFALALALEALLPDPFLRRAGALALVGAHRRLLEQGPAAAYTLLRSLHLLEPIEQIERWRLLSACCTARGRSASLRRCASVLDALLTRHQQALSLRGYAHGLLALGIARGRAGAYEPSANALRACLDVLVLEGGQDVHVASMRLSACRGLAMAERRLGHLDEAAQLYAEAETLARHAGTPHIGLEIANNRAVLLQQRGAHAESVGMLQAALASPWSAERGLRPLLQSSLADALGALGDRSGAAQALHDALADLQAHDVYGLAGHVRAARALLLAESGHTVAAESELAAGAPPSHPATLLARALCHDPLSPAARPALQAALDAAATDLPLRAQIRAHLACICAMQQDYRRARAYESAVRHDRAYPLTPREAAILDSRAHRVRQPSSTTAPASALDGRASGPVSVRFFGAPTLSIGGRPVGSGRWAHSKVRELLWYALAHGRTGFTREEASADLFPDLDAEAAGRALRNTLYELRKVLRATCGADTFQVPKGERLCLLPEELGTPWEADTLTLESWLACVRRGEVAAIGNVAALLAGPFLDDLHADWTRPFRHYWEREAVHALDLVASHYERAGRVEEALGCLRRAVDFSPDDPALLRRVLLLYHSIGDLGGLRATFLAHRRALREELAVDPDPEVSDLYRTLTRS